MASPPSGQGGRPARRRARSTSRTCGRSSSASATAATARVSVLLLGGGTRSCRDAKGEKSSPRTALRVTTPTAASTWPCSSRRAPAERRTNSARGSCFERPAGLVTRAHVIRTDRRASARRRRRTRRPDGLRAPLHPRPRTSLRREALWRKPAPRTTRRVVFAGHMYRIGQLSADERRPTMRLRSSL